MPRPRRLLHLISRVPRSVANPRSDKPASTLPGSLDVLLPSCSKACLRAFIADNYPSSSSNDIPTLCTTTTASGFTLGEAALICESAYCAANGQVDKSIFSVCDTVPQAIRPSHDSLTVVPMATSRLGPDSNAFSSALPAAIVAPESTGIDATGIASATDAPPTPSISESAPPPPAAPLLPSPTPSTPASSSSSPIQSSSLDTSIAATTTRPGESDPFITSSSSPTVAPETQQASGNLSTSQIVGISLAALAIFAFVIALLLFFYYRRKARSRHRRGSRWSDVIDKQLPSSFPPAERQMEAGCSDGPAAVADHSQRFYAPATTTQEKRRSFWRRSIKPEDIGVAVTPEVAQGGSPTSISSQRTISQLLPELPNYSLWPAPLKKSQQVTPEGRRELPRPTITFPSTFVEKKKANKPPRIVSARTGNGLPTDPRAQMYKLQQAKNANGKIPLTPVYDNGNVPTTFGAILASRENALLHPAHPSQLQTGRYHDRCLQPQTFGQQPPVPPKSTLAPPPSVHFQTTRTHPAPTMRRNSSASDSTTFEDDEDSTPGQESERDLRPTPLSPVAESPRHFPNSPLERITAPLRELTYPSPPRSAAISKQAERPARTRAAQPVDASVIPGSASSGFNPITPLRKDQSVPLGRHCLGATPSSSPSPAPKRDHSPSSLLAKRRGDKAADQMMQRGLKLSSAAANAPAGKSKNAQATGQKEERGRRRSDTENSMDCVLKTPPMQKGGLKSPPVWTPKLTPTRRGEDLYLTVE